MPDQPAAQVLAIPEGAVLILTVAEPDPKLHEAIVETLPGVVGHDRFGVIFIEAGTGAADVLGPDDDLVAALTEALTEAMALAVRPGARSGLRPLPTGACTCNREPATCALHGHKQRVT